MRAPLNDLDIWRFKNNFVDADMVFAPESRMSSCQDWNKLMLKGIHFQSSNLSLTYSFCEESDKYVCRCGSGNYF